MTLSRKHLQRLKSTMKHRELRPVSSYQPAATLRISPRQRDRITRTNPNLLLGIESLIVKTWKNATELNDHDVEQALISVIQRTPLSTDGPGQQLAQALQEKGELFTEDGLPDEDWLLALRAILSSVQTHMGGAGSQNYLNYAERFVANINHTQRLELG